MTTEHAEAPKRDCLCHCHACKKGCACPVAGGCCPEAPKGCNSSRCDGVNHWLGDQAFACPNAPPEAPREAIWDNTTVCYGSDCPNCAREKAEGKPAPAPEPKRGCEEPIDFEVAAEWARRMAVDPSNNAARAYLALRAEVERLKRDAARHEEEEAANCPEDQSCIETIKALRAELAAAREEIAVRDASISDYARQMADIREHWHAEATENVTLKADLAAEKARSDRAEERAEALEEKIVRWVMAEETLDHYCNGPDEHCDDEPGVEADLADEVDMAKSDLDSEARAILAARAKEGEING